MRPTSPPSPPPFPEEAPAEDPIALLAEVLALEDLDSLEARLRREAGAGCEERLRHALRELEAQRANLRRRIGCLAGEAP